MLNLFNLYKIEKYSVRQIALWLWYSLKENRLQATLNALLGLIEVVISLALVWAMQRAIDIAAGSVDGRVMPAVVLIGVLMLLDFMQRVGIAWLRNVLGVKAQNRMQSDLLEKQLRLKWRGKNELHTGDVLNRMELDVRTVVTFLTETLPSVLSTMALFVGAFFYLYFMDAWLALITVIIVPVFALLSKVYVRQMRRFTSIVRQADSKVQSVMQETLLHRVLVKSMEIIPLMIKRLEASQDELQHGVERRTYFVIFSSTMLNLGFTLGYILAFGWAAIRMSAGTLTFGGMTAFLQLVGRIQTPARELTRLIPACANVFTAAERLMELEEGIPEDAGDDIMLGSPCGLTINNITYAYPDAENAVFKQFTHDFQPGSCTAILGETGAGKTTLIRLLLALLEPQEGEIEIYDGSKRQRLSARHRCNFVYVPQGNTMFSGTIRENLLQGNAEATDEMMWNALRKSQAGFVEDLPDGLDTQCAELGGGLSEGQAQRIAIARALLRNRSIMLLDEATSALDSETEHRLLNSLMADKQRTVIFITHREAVLAYCNERLSIG